MSGAELRRAILDLAERRGPDKTLCPSEVARAVAGPDETKWRPLMRPIEAEAAHLAREGCVALTRKGRPIDPHATIRGIYRIAIVGDGATRPPRP